MDYHADRFSDASLVARDARGRIVAVLPACGCDATVWSHRGLTYGGWLMHESRCDAAVMLELMPQAAEFLSKQGFKTLVYKPVPFIYHRCCADDDLYALWRNGAQWEASSVSSCIDLAHRHPFDRGNRSNVHHARREGLTIRDDDHDFTAFWDLLGDVLEKHHGTTPVHSLDEIMLLHSRFPENIRLHTVWRNDALMAGVVMYCCGTAVAHCQYIAASDEGRQRKALALLFDHLIELSSSAGFRYFDFGTSNEESGRVLNTGLLHQKNRLGGRAVAYNSFTLAL